jgi:hypothetical protein
MSEMSITEAPNIPSLKPNPGFPSQTLTHPTLGYPCQISTLPKLVFPGKIKLSNLFHGSTISPSGECKLSNTQLTVPQILLAPFS